ncbi:MAG: Rrf2 family protein [Acidobacteria bacterium OLB17]|nr:MAG: Rrf2 family protein [Acidobacteria bacterium OLB17]MCZ2392185.1 Rrf2 family transcriptional regulator [Acidobacteriota bacterium]
MILSKTTGYGVMALAYLAGKDASKVCGLQEIAETECIPPIYLRKVLGELRRHRLLRSVKGIHGGYSLARMPETITIWEVNQILAPDPYIDECILGFGICKAENACALHESWQRIRREYVELLESTTIAQIAQSKRRRIFRSLANEDEYFSPAEDEDEWS